MNKIKLLIILIIITLIAIGAYVWLNKQNKSVKVPAQQSAHVKKVNVDFSKSPEKFPSNIPMEADARITQNYNATGLNGTFQATRTFETAQSLASNLDLYKNFFTKEGWTVKATTDEPTFKMIMGVKDNQTLQVLIDENKVNKIKTVSITYTESKN